VLYVGVGQTYTTIQAAVDYANSSDTIFVYNGTYYEHVNITKAISLVGLNRETTVIDGGSNGTVIKLNANGASIRGFTLRNGGSDPGISMNNSNGNSVENNIIANNYDGVKLESSSNNIIKGNVIESNVNYGILITLFSDNNVISGNSLELNEWYGIGIILASSGNINYHNNFNNTRQAINNPESVNVWSNEGEGNYWSDYHGLDLNKDGVGDTPYSIHSTGNYTDNYPLMGRFSDFNVAFQKQNFEVAVISNSTVSDFRFELGSETGNKIMRYHAEGANGTLGFSRVRIPRALMDYPYTVIAGEEVSSTLLAFSNSTYAYVYFTYNHTTQSITIFTSKAMSLYVDLLRTHLDLETNLASLNSTYQTLLANYSSLLANYTQLQQSYNSLNDSNQRLLEDSYKSIQNIQNLSYIFAAIVAVFIVITVYLSKRAPEPSTARRRPEISEATHERQPNT
jgi:parallel beta-helix repeat protein